MQELRRETTATVVRMRPPISMHLWPLLRTLWKHGTRECKKYDEMYGYCFPAMNQENTHLYMRADHVQLQKHWQRVEQAVKIDSGGGEHMGVSE